MRIHFVMVKPRVPENIGAAARALETMGFDSLILVEPRGHKEDKCKWVATKAYHLIEQAEICLSLEEALIDMDITVGTTAKARNLHYEFLTPDKLRSSLQAKIGVAKNVAIVFGPEDSGLSNEQLKLCDLITNIPTQNEYGILNLAQALMLYAYELGKLTNQEVRNARPEKQEFDFGTFKSKITELLEAVDVDPESDRIQKLFEKLSRVNNEEMQLIHFLRKKILYKIDGDFTRGR
jgi:tRNA/rRNA methyltransferase